MSNGRSVPRGAVLILLHEGRLSQEASPMTPATSAMTMTMTRRTDRRNILRPGVDGLYNITDIPVHGTCGDDVSGAQQTPRPPVALMIKPRCAPCRLLRDNR